MDNPEYTFQILEVFSKIKTKEIPRELEEYISYVARTGDPVFQWSLVKVLLKEKLLAVLDEFMENGSCADIPPCPNVEIFNYENMKINLLARLDSFVLPPFTIQRICELLTAPRKEYNRIDKYMRALEKNVLVVSASDLSLKRGLETDGNDSVINGILEKVNDSLNSFTNHIFSEEQEDELNVSSKLDETDAVQQIIDESWSEENNEEFKLNGTNNSTLNVSFENELQFVSDKSADDKNTTCESKESDSSFGNNSMLIEPSIQNIIAESSDISFETMAKPDSSFEDSTSKNDTYEFKDDSVTDEVNMSLVSQNEMFSNMSSSEISEVDNISINNVDENNENNESVDVAVVESAEPVEDNTVPNEYNDFSEKKDENSTESIEDVRENKSAAYEAEVTQPESTKCEEKKESTKTDFPNDLPVVEDVYVPSMISETIEMDTLPASEEIMDENTFSSGDNEELPEKSVEEANAAPDISAEIQTESSEPSSSTD